MGTLDIAEALDEISVQVFLCAVVVIEWHLFEDVVHVPRIERHLEMAFATTSEENDEGEIFLVEQRGKCAG